LVDGDVPRLLAVKIAGTHRVIAQYLINAGSSTNAVVWSKLKNRCSSCMDLCCYCRLQSFAIGGAIMGLGGALYAHFVGYIAPEDFLPILTFQLWTMLIVGGAGNNRGAVLGALVVWFVWTIAGNGLRELVPPADQARAAALQIVLVGVLLAAMLVWRPHGLIGERLADKK
jgi:ABC-type branched-subunit amino acid transport system permease subunit